MCDTFVCPPSQSASGKMLLGKNSDRDPNEAQHIVSISPDVQFKNFQQCTYIAIPAPRPKFEIIISKPFQMWGAEMGVNEKGLAIGNEAVFTKISIKKNNSGLTGMDILRLTLQSCASAEEAIEYMSELIENYGQDACGGYSDKNFYYHNSFIIADPNEAYVMDTAGHFWVTERVEKFRAISNGLSIDQNYHKIHPGAIPFATTNGWHKKGSSFSFRKSFSALLMPRLAACDFRRDFSEKQAKAQFTIPDAFQLLRGHSQSSFTPAKGSTQDICMHSSGLFCPHQSTGSMVVALSSHQNEVWLTGSSAPCLSFFKPFFFGTNVLSHNNFKAPTGKSDESYWWTFERFHRKALLDYSNVQKQVAAFQHTLESQSLQQLASVIAVDEKEKLSKQALQLSLDVIDKIIIHPQKTHSMLYRRHWKQLNKVAAFQLDS